MRSYVPKLSSNSNICQAFFEKPGRQYLDTLEQIFQIQVILGYGFDTNTPPRASDIRTETPESHT